MHVTVRVWFHDIRHTNWGQSCRHFGRCFRNQASSVYSIGISDLTELKCADTLTMPRTIIFALITRRCSCGRATRKFILDDQCFAPIACTGKRPAVLYYGEWRIKRSEWVWLLDTRTTPSTRCMIRAAREFYCLDILWVSSSCNVRKRKV